MDIVRAFIADVEKNPDGYKPSCQEFKAPEARRVILQRAQAAKSQHPSAGAP